MSVGNQCIGCTRFMFGVCAAYPDGIPVEILNGTVDHTKPYKGDHGILFEAVDRD